MYYFSRYGGNHMGWFTWNDALRVSKHVEYAIYSIAFSEDMPNKFLLPFDVEDTIYVGIAGGKYFDKKNRTATGGSLQTYLTKRLLSHNVQLNDLKKVKEKKYKIFHETHTPSLNPHKQLFYGLSILDFNKRTNNKLVRCAMKSIEDEFCLLYGENFEEPPLMNLEHKTNSRKRNPNSTSARVMNSPSLIPFVNQS